MNITYSVVFNLSVSKVSAEPLGKSKNTRVGSLSLLQQIFPTQESNWDLLHCRWILSAELPRKALKRIRIEVYKESINNALEIL